MRLFKALFVISLLFGLGAIVQPAHATIILEGSDAIGFHSGCGAPPSCDAGVYRDQAWSAIGGADPRPIAVIGHQPVTAGIIVSGTHPIVSFETVPAAGPLGGYAALYFLATSGCCTEDDTLPAGNEAAISAYLAAGGTVMIENYTGSAAWDFAVGAGGAGNAHVGGVSGGFPSSLGCSDGETVTPTGIANGFSQPAAMGCWTHQAYDQSFFGPLGFTLSFFNSPTGLGVDGFSSLLSNGRTITGGAPEPTTLALLGAGLVAAGFARRRSQK